MKKIILISFITLLAVSCATTGIKETIVVDYKRYFDKDFFLTESNSVNFDYTPIASVVTVAKGKNQIEATYYDEDRPNVKYSARNRRGGSQPKKTKEVRYTLYDALDELVNKSHRMGANGIINLRIIYTYDKEFGAGYEVSGMAIKR